MPFAVSPAFNYLKNWSTLSHTEKIIRIHTCIAKLYKVKIIILKTFSDIQVFKKENVTPNFGKHYLKNNRSAEISVIYDYIEKFMAQIKKYILFSFGRKILLLRCWR